MELLDTKGLQEFLHISRDRSYSLMNSKAFPSIRIGSRHYVERAEVEKWLQRYKYHEFKL